MDDWSDCSDPDELRIRLDMALEENAELQQELTRLRADNARLLSILGRDTQTAPAATPPVAEPIPVVLATCGAQEHESSSGVEVRCREEPGVQVPEQRFGLLWDHVS
ncbi:hypothetical protein GCM10009753_79110 [Streptantibioticus ferralitis]